VNKVNTKVEIRFHLDSATWIPEDIRDRFKKLFPNRINKEGEVFFTSDKGRTQEGNLKDCIYKIEEALFDASIPEYEKVETEPPEYANENRIREKKKKSDIKKSRNWNPYRD
jgi:peptidyl-tRNA hydrolase ICT1